MRRTETVLLERGLMTGKTRSGKTTLCRRILSRENLCAIIDPKHCFSPLPVWDLRDQEYHITEDPEDAGRLLGRGHVIFRPAPDAGDAVYNEVLKAWWDSGIVHTLDVDELVMLCPNPMRFPAFLRAYWQMGGERGLKALGISQRPSGLPGFLFSESEQHWMFDLLLKRDRERAREWIGDAAHGGTARLHSFWYRNVNGGPAKQFELDFGG